MSDADDFLKLVQATEILAGTSSTTGGSQESSSKSNISLSGESRDRLEISDEAIDKIVSDVLSGPDGLAAIFAGEQNAGIFDSSVANQAAGDLSAKITGEIAKLRAERVQTQKQEQTQTTESESDSLQRSKKKGLLKKIFGF